MGLREETVVREFWTDAQGAWDDAVIDRLVDHLAQDVRYHVYAWEHAVVGKDAVRDELARQAPMWREFRSEIVAMASDDRTVFMERHDSLLLGRKPLTQHAVAVFEVDDEGKIAAWRDYYDSMEFARKLGADVNKVSTAGVRGYDA